MMPGATLTPYPRLLVALPRTQPLVHARSPTDTGMQQLMANLKAVHRARLRPSDLPRTLLMHVRSLGWVCVRAWHGNPALNPLQNQRA